MPEPRQHTALVLGGLGIIGRNLIEYLSTRPSWAVKAVSRRAPDFPTAADFRPLDLSNPESLERAAPWLADVTHVFYAAYQEKADPAEASRVNTGMLRNVIAAVERAAEGFRHVTFIQGGKAYGAHLGLYKTPAKETDPRHFGTNFYYDQEDFLREASRGKHWSWTALRPDIVFGFAVGNPMNLGNVIACYASLCKETGVPLRFPGSPRAYEILANVTDAGLLAKAMEWAALDERCRGEIFNVTNGDVFRWSQIFPLVADALGIECAPPQTFSLTDAMRDQGPRWESMIKKHGLEQRALSELANWPFGDFIFNVEHDAFFDVSKARRFGFHEMTLDTGQEIVRLLRELRERRVIPR